MGSDAGSNLVVRTVQQRPTCGQGRAICHVLRPIFAPKRRFRLPRARMGIAVGQFDDLLTLPRTSPSQFPSHPIHPSHPSIHPIHPSCPSVPEKPVPQSDTCPLRRAARPFYPDSVRFPPGCSRTRRGRRIACSDVHQAFTTRRGVFSVRVAQRPVGCPKQNMVPRGPPVDLFPDQAPRTRRVSPPPRAALPRSHQPAARRNTEL